MPNSSTAAEDLLKLDNQVCFALVTAARNVVAIYRPILEPLGLTHPQYLVMLALWERSPRPLGDLAADLAMEPPTLSPLVKRLEALGLVSRTRSSRDERVLDVGLTAAGRELREQALAVPAHLVSLKFGPSPGQQQIVQSLQFRVPVGHPHGDSLTGRGFGQLQTGAGHGVLLMPVRVQGNDQL